MTATKPVRVGDTQRLHQLHEEATPAPWSQVAIVVGRDGDGDPSESLCLDFTEDGGPEDFRVFTDADAELILAARNALPALLEEVDRLRTAVAGVGEFATALSRSSARHPQMITMDVVRTLRQILGAAEAGQRALEASDAGK